MLVAGPQATAQDRHALEAAAAAVREAGHEAKPLPSGSEADAMRRAVRAADAVVALVDDPVDPAVAACLGYAHAFRRTLVGLRSDARPGPDPTLRGLLPDLLPVPDWSATEWRERLAQSLSRVRVYAGNLVRDAVPKILEAEGRSLRFRQAASDEYPAILKRKLVETAQTLEEAEWGVEQETIADLLEVLETFLNVRAYDRESLRSIKEGKWRKRGGFQKGYLVDEEPKLASG